MGDAYWMVALALLLVADLAIGVCVGWLWCSAAGGRSQAADTRDTFERMFRRNEELFRVIYTLLRQSREYTGRLDQVRDRLAELPQSTTTRIVTDLIESVHQMHGELSTTQDRLQRQLDLSQEATSLARGAHGMPPASKPSTAPQPPPDAETTPIAGAPAAQTAPSASDIRREERHPYRHHQMAAPYIQGKIPTPQMFQAVQCCDLSSGGVSYVTHERPASDMIVITIGDERNIVYRTARIAQVLEIEGEEEFGRMFRVGCQFTGRLHRHLFG